MALGWRLGKHRDHLRDVLRLLLNPQTLGAADASHDEIARRANEVFFDTVTLLLDRAVTVVAEAAFQHRLWAPRLTPLLRIARVRIVLCEIDPELARARWISRRAEDPNRARLHNEEAGKERLRESYDPPRLDVPLLRVDTANGYIPAFETIVEFCRA